MNIFFDVDYTIMGADGSLRHRTEEVFQKLLDDGHNIYIWSGAGNRTQDIRRLGLEGYVSKVFLKPLEDFENGMKTFGVDVWPEFIIDDHPEIVKNFGGFVCRPYYFRNAKDDEMDIIYGVISDVINAGNSEHSAYYPGKKNSS